MRHQASRAASSLSTGATGRRSRSSRAEVFSADELEGDSGYRRLQTSGGVGWVSGSAARSKNGRYGRWLSDEVLLERRLGTPDTTAQVHPGAFTAALMRAAQNMGAELVTGEAQEIIWADDAARAIGVRVNGSSVEGDAVVIAMGPWSALAGRWLPLPRVYGSKGHSMVFKTGSRMPPEALFLEVQEEDGTLLSPEIIPRADGTTWACAVSSSSPLPLDPAKVAPDPGAMERLHSVCRRVSPVLADSPVLHQQACFRPATADGLPLIGGVADFPGVYVATGHSVWGILNAPGTGEAIAELVLDGVASSLNLSPFSSDRLAPTLLPGTRNITGEL